MHRAQSVSLLWIADRIGVVEQCCQMVKYNTIFHKNGVILHACVHGRRKECFQGGPIVDFSNSFSRGATSSEMCFLPFETKITAFLLKFSNSCPYRHLCLYVGKVRATSSKTWGNFKRFNIILNSEILLNLLRKMKYSTDKFQLCFVFAVAMLNSYILFLHWQKNSHPCGQLASCYVCIVLSLYSGI